MPDTIDDRPAKTDVAHMLEAVDQAKANHMVDAFTQAAAEVTAHNGEAMWAIALLQARVLAQAEIGEQQVWAASRFHDMVRMALPGMIVAVERARRKATGDRPFDA